MFGMRLHQVRLTEKQSTGNANYKPVKRLIRFRGTISIQALPFFFKQNAIPDALAPDCMRRHVQNAVAFGIYIQYLSNYGVSRFRISILHAMSQSPIRNGEIFADIHLKFNRSTPGDCAEVQGDESPA